MALIAIVGMSGSGKTFAADFFSKRGFEKVYFGGIVLDEIKKRMLELNEANERKVREGLRMVHGMAAMALLSIPKIKGLLADRKNVVIDGLYSWQELIALKKEFSELLCIAVIASPKTRYARMLGRKDRALSEKECIERDKSEIENIQKAGPIAMSDFSIVNEGSKKEFEKELEKILKKIEK